MKSLILKLKNDPRVKNSLWMLIEKGISFFGLIFVVAAVAKYTGSAIYGEIALATSIFIVLKAVSQIGMDQIYFKYASQNKKFNRFMFGNSLILISIVYIFVAFFTVVWAYFYLSITGFYFIVATAIAYYFTSIDLMNAYFEGVLLSKLNVIANILGVLVYLILRYGIVFFKLNVVYFTIPIVAYSLIPFCIKFYLFRDVINKHNIKRIAFFRRKYFKYILSAGIPLTLAALSATLNGQIATFLLAYLYDTKHVAYFSVAFVLAGSWCIVSTTLIMSFITSIYKTPYHEELNYVISSAKLLRIISLISLILALFVVFFAKFIILFLYGNEYFESIQILQIMALTQFFWVIGFYFSRLIIKFNGFKFLAIKTVISLLINFVLSYFLILKFGLLGAAYAALITELISALILNMFFKQAKLSKVILISLGLSKGK